MTKMPEVLSATTPLSDSSVVALRPGSDDRVAGGMLSLLLFCRAGARIVPLVEGRRLVLGRTRPADVVIGDESISRQHARVVLRDGRVFLEDLGSTNGTRIDGRRITEVEAVAPGDRVAVGRVPAVVQRLGSLEERQFGLFGHEAFSLDLEAEVVRARAFDRRFVLMLVRGTRTDSADTAAWFIHLTRHLRAFDRIAVYGSQMVEVLLPEAGADRAAALIDRLRQDHPTLVAGIAAYPDHGSSAGELLQAVTDAARKATTRSPVRAAAAVSPGRITQDDAGEASPVVANPRMRALFDTARQLASSHVPVLILGETGTGKELVARALHEGGRRADRPLVCVNCAALPDSLLESLLFGHEKGAFTGADRRKKGLFEEADGGSVFLDEVGELPPGAQASLLRVLETGRFSRLGSHKEIQIDVRVIAATNRDLSEMRERGAFREDLFYRINTITLEVPPLRDRPEEIVPLAKHFVNLANQASDRSVRAVHADVVERLKAHAWPGNVRELRNTMERAVAIASSNEIGLTELPAFLCGDAHAGLAVTSIPIAPADHDEGDQPGDIALDLDLRAEVDRFERGLIVDALRRADWSRRVAAERLCLPRRTLAHKIARYGIERP